MDGRRWPVILMYHAIDPPGRWSGWRWAVSDDDFRRQLDLLARYAIRTVRLSDVVGAQDTSVVITFDDGYADNHRYALSALVERGQVATWFIPGDRVGRSADWVAAEGEERPLMDGSQLHDLLQAGMEIGGHGCTHRDLTTLSDGELEREVVIGRRALEERIGCALPTFAYPFGLHDDRVRRAVAAAGYRYACTTRPGWWGSDSDPLQLRRVAIFGGDSLSTFARKLAFADTEVSWRKMARYYRRRLLDRLAR